MTSVEHEIESLKSGFEKNNKDLLSEPTPDPDVDGQLEDIKNGILRIEKYLINQFKFNNVLAKEISDNKYDMAYVKAKLLLDLPTTSKGNEHYEALHSIFRSYPKSTPRISFPRDGESEYCTIYLDFSCIAPRFDPHDTDEAPAKTLTRACMGYENDYYLDSQELVYDSLDEQSYFYNSELRFNKLGFDEYQHIDPASTYVLKKGVLVHAYIFEKKVGCSASSDSCLAEVVSVKKSMNNDYGYDVILKLSLDQYWSTKDIIKKFTIDDFPCIVDEQYVIALMSIDPTKSPAPTETFGAEQLPSGFDPKKPTLIQYGEDYWFYGNTDGSNWKTQKLEPKPDLISQWFDINFSTRHEIPLHHPQSMSICNYFTSMKAHTIDETPIYES